MKPRAIALALAAASAVALDAQPRATPPSFRFERPVVTNGGGPRRLAIDAALLAGAAPFRATVRARDRQTGAPTSLALFDGLRDLRLYDASGTEVGYLLVPVPPPEPLYKTAAILPVAPVDTDKVKTSGFEADLGEPLLVDRLRIGGVSAPFLKRVTLEASGDRQHWTMLVAEGTLFDLPEERLQQAELQFTPGMYRYLRLTWDDRYSARVTDSVSAAAGRRPLRPSPSLTTPVAVERRPSEPGRSRFRVTLPAGHLPIIALELDAGGGHILREARVFEPQLNDGRLAPRALGHATLRRVVRGDVAAAALRLPIDPPTEAQLDLEIDDEDNPPLELRGVAAVFADLPWIYLEAPAGPLTARYGNDALDAPRYDLEATRGDIRIEAAADASWGAPRARVESESAAAAAPPLPTFGASLDLGLFTYVRSVPAGEGGLVALPLDPAVLAHSAGVARRFGDLRVVDDADRQIPYLLEQLGEPLSIDVKLERVEAPKTLPPARSGRSVYRVTYPIEGLPPARLVMTTSARVFERRVAIGEERERDERRRDRSFDALAAAVWRHADQDRAAMPMAIDVPAIHATELLVIVDEGDNTPLPIETARLLLPSYRIRLYRGTGTPLRVAYGRSDLPRPQYDLALLAPQVLGAAAREVRLDAERSVQSSDTAALVSPRLFWFALAIAVVVLAGFIVRLLRQV